LGAGRRQRRNDRKNPEALVVAEHIITFVKGGERDAVRLCDLAVKAVRTERRLARPERMGGLNAVPR
jgi:hypothetical protein